MQEGGRDRNRRGKIRGGRKGKKEEEGETGRGEGTE